MTPVATLVLPRPLSRSSDLNQLSDLGFPKGRHPHDASAPSPPPKDTKTTWEGCSGPRGPSTFWTSLAFTGPPVAETIFRIMRLFSLEFPFSRWDIDTVNCSQETLPLGPLACPITSTLRMPSYSLMTISGGRASPMWLCEGQAGEKARQGTS